MAADFVPELYRLDDGSIVVPRSGHPAAHSFELGDDWTKLVRRWAVPYVRTSEDEECFADGECMTHGQVCNCFVIVHWQKAKLFHPSQRQAIWWLP